MAEVWTDWFATWRPGWYEPVDPWTGLLLSAGGLLLIVVVHALIQKWFQRVLDRKGRGSAAMWSDRVKRWSLLLVLVVNLFNVLILNQVGIVRFRMGDLVLIDELVVLAGPILAVMSLWWWHYPIVRRLQEATLIRHLDMGQPVYPIWTRWQYVLAQVRLHFVLLLLPILLILTWGELLEVCWPFEADGGVLSATVAQPVLLFFGVGCIFLFAPVMIRFLWDTKPMPACFLREQLESMCRAHRIRIRTILVWNTFGGMTNAAVMGLIAPVRYVLLSDALLDSMNDREVEAVMAHELGHVRRHHLPWLAIALLALFGLTDTLGDLMINGVPWSDEMVMVEMNPPHHPPPTTTESSIDPIRTGIEFCIALAAFGWVSRRFERQADTFAVQHLSGMTRREGQDKPVTDMAIGAMCQALRIVAECSHIPVTRRSWRHGSIAFRIRYLQKLEGLACEKLPIDRLVRWIKWGSVIALLVVFGYWALEAWV